MRRRRGEWLQPDRRRARRVGDHRGSVLCPHGGVVRFVGGDGRGVLAEQVRGHQDRELRAVGVDSGRGHDGRPDGVVVLGREIRRACHAGRVSCGVGQPVGVVGRFHSHRFGGRPAPGVGERRYRGPPARLGRREFSGQRPPRLRCFQQRPGAGAGVDQGRRDLGRCVHVPSAAVAPRRAADRVGAAGRRSGERRSARRQSMSPAGAGARRR
ncbi:hypothetical protein C1Y40_04624 [Mycobacterium talmoniae]|uniref:Uncharacterized protein n=1 Tax=Mycobacterium talmoniae TaxID=1858794 RepID=A0A2S8BEZ4_9MYCO|nr:hypothetical protein C1Y40_04624 [Mycobacterium talmoniae]